MAEANGSDTKAPRISKAFRAGLQLNVGRVRRHMKTKSLTDFRVADSAAVYMTAVMEYIAAEVIELAGTDAVNMKRKTIKDFNLRRAIENDPELSKLFVTVDMPESKPFRTINLDEEVQKEDLRKGRRKRRYREKKTFAAAQKPRKVKPKKKAVSKK